MRVLVNIVVPALVAVAVPSAGCAAMSAKAPDPNRGVADAPICNSSKGAVGVDALLALAIGLGGAVALEESGTAGALLLLTSGAYTVSAVTGNSSANKCLKAQAEYAAYRQDERAMGGLAIAPPDAPADADDDDAPVAPGATGPAVRPTPPAPAAKPPAPPAPAPAPKPAAKPAAPAGPVEPYGGDDDPGPDDADAAPADADADGNPWHAFWQEVR